LVLVFLIFTQTLTGAFGFFFLTALHIFISNNNNNNIIIISDPKAVLLPHALGFIKNIATSAKKSDVYA